MKKPPEVQTLNPFSVQFRYPGESATLEESKIALKTMQKLRKYFREKFGLQAV